MCGRSKFSRTKIVVSQPVSDPQQMFLLLTWRTSRKSLPSEESPSFGSSQQFPNVHSVQIRPQCVMWHSRRYPYPIRTLVETHHGMDLEPLKASMKVVLCTGI